MSWKAQARPALHTTPRKRSAQRRTDSARPVRRYRWGAKPSAAGMDCKPPHGGKRSEQARVNDLGRRRQPSEAGNDGRP